MMKKCVKYYNYCCQFEVIGHLNQIMLSKEKLLELEERYTKKKKNVSEGQEFPHFCRMTQI